MASFVIAFYLLSSLWKDKAPAPPVSTAPVALAATPSATPPAPLAQMLNARLSSTELKLLKAEFAGIPASSDRFAEAQQLLASLDSRIKQAEKKEAKEKDIADARRTEILQSNIESLKKMTDIPATKESILIRVASFAALAKIVAEAETSHDPNAKKVGAQFKAQLSRTQTAQFPKLRQAWAAMLDEAMWEYDMDVRVLGENNKTIELISAVFAANANIKKIHNTIHEPLENLRFRRVQYRWFKGADEYTYYTLGASADSDVAQ